MGVRVAPGTPNLPYLLFSSILLTWNYHQFAFPLGKLYFLSVFLSIMIYTLTAHMSDIFPKQQKPDTILPFLS
ncbi:hypothetical protein J4G02_16725, partial [Candidatus Poribacteria bacterium]|nr:hypothetical protein [Candidatus Poribacteria bacterium]